MNKLSYGQGWPLAPQLPLWLAAGVAVLVAVVLMVTIIMLRAREAARWRLDLVAFDLRFPRGMESTAVAIFIAGLSGLSTGGFRRPFAIRAVMVETSATIQGIAHRLLTSRRDAPVVLAALRAALPDVAVREDEDYEPHRPTVAVELGVSSLRRPLAADKAQDVSRQVLAGMQPLASGERVVVQWSLRPVGPVSRVTESPRRRRPRSLVEGLVWSFLSGPTVSREAAEGARAKQSSPLFVASGRIAATAVNTGRAQQLLGRVVPAFAAMGTPGANLYRRRLPNRVVARAVTERRLPVATYPLVVNAAELAALVGFPLGDVALPGLRLGGTRQLAPSSDVPSGGRILGRATFPGAERPVAISVTDSLRHLHVIGPTGSGKSTLLIHLIVQDMAAGRGVVVLDPKGDLVADVLDRVPQHREADVIILDPTDDERPVGLNLLAGSQRSPELVTEQALAIFHGLYRDSWGPRLEDVLRSALLTLVPEPGMTLTEIPLLLTDPGFRRRLVGKVNDPVALAPFWSWYESLSDGERAQVIAPVMNKLRAVLVRRRIRNVIGQAHPKLDLDEALARKKILLVPLAKGSLGEEAAALVGALVIAKMWQSVMKRVDIPADRRPVTFAYIDEFQDFLHLPTNVGDVLAQARGLKLGLTLAHQHLGQLPSKLKDDVLANARSRVIFQTAARDGAVLAKEFGSHLDALDLQGLDPYQVVMSISTGSRVAPPVTGTTTLPPEPTGRAELVRAASRERYGVDRAEVEAQIRKRHEGRRPGGQVGRREREVSS